MRVIQEFIFKVRKQSVNKEVQKQVSILTEKMKKYIVSNLVDDPIYRLEEESILFQDVVELYMKNKKEIEFNRIRYQVEMEENELENAVAFLLLWPNHYCLEYDDVSYQWEECETCWCAKESNDMIYVKPEGYIKKNQNKEGMLLLVDLEKVVLLPNLVEKLVEGGVAKHYFKPVYTKRKKIIGYVFDSPNVLPKNSYKDYNYEIDYVCPVCGETKLSKNKDVCYIFPQELVLEGEGVLEDVNYTYEFYDWCRRILISPKIQKIISQHIKDAKFVPVFKMKEQV